MKFSAARETLLTPLAQVVGVIERRQTLPILSHVLIVLEHGRLSLTGTDLEIQLVARTELEAGEPGAVTVPARKLLDILRLLPERGEVQVEAREERLALRCGGSRFNLATLPVDNYPAFDSGATEFSASLPAECLRTALDKTMFAMAQQDVRYYLNGLLLDFEGSTLRAVASDGHRLALFQETLEQPFAGHRQIIVPRKGVQELARLLGDAAESLTIEIAPNTVRVDLGATQFSAKLIEGRYPDYQRVMPRDLNRVYRIDKDRLRGALSRVSVLSLEKQRSISLEVRAEEGLLVLRSQNAEQEEAEERLELEIEGGDLSVGFNAGYLLEAIGHVDSEAVRLSFTAAANSSLIEDLADARFRYVVMPMRL